MTLRGATDKPSSPGGETTPTVAREGSMAAAMEEMRARRAVRTAGTSDDGNPLRRPTPATIPVSGDQQPARGLLDPGAGQSAPAGDRQAGEDDDEDDIFTALEPEPSGNTSSRPDDDAGTDDDPIVWHEDDGTPVRRSEARAGNMRRKTFSQKTEEVAQARRQFEQGVAEVQKQREDYVKLLATAHSADEQSAPKAPGDDLRQTDPLEYDRQVTAYLLHQEKMRTRMSEMERVAQEHQQTYLHNVELRRQEEQAKMIEAVPALKRVASDPVKLSAAFSRYKQAAKSYGYSDQELAQLTDHRAIVLLDHALRYRAMTRKRSSEQGSGSSSSRSSEPNVTLKGTVGGGGGGSGNRPGQSAAKVSNAMAKLEQTGRAGDAMEVMRARRLARQSQRR